MTHSILKFPIFRIWIFLKYTNFSWFIQVLNFRIEAIFIIINKIYITIPISCNFMKILYFLSNCSSNFSFKFECLFWEPSPFNKSYLAIQFIISYDSNFHCTSNIHIRGSHNQIMNTQIWCNDFILFIMICEFDIRSILLYEFHSFPWYHCICLLIAPENVTCFPTFAIVGSDRRMVWDLFRKKFKIVIDELVGFSEKGIEWFGIWSFNASVLSWCIYGNHG